MNLYNYKLKYEELSDVITPYEAAAYLGVHVKTVYSYIHDGRIQAARCGNKYRLRKEWVIDFLEDQSTQVGL